jgi:putative phosphoesterase
MTRIAILADIHGNLPALEVVMEDLKRMSPDRVIVNGDIINRGPQSRECLAAIRATGWPVVYGNHEEYIIKFDYGEWPEEWYTDWWLPTRRIWEEMTEEEIAFIETMPWFYIVNVPGLPPIRVLHGSPWALNDGLGYWLSDSELLAVARRVPQKILVGAHTHRPFNHRVGERWILNCGAVGAPFNGNPAAQYLVLTGENGKWETNFRSIPYDRTPVYEAWERTGYMQRSMTAQVFKYELETATYHMTSYLSFCRANKLSENELASFEQYRYTTTHTSPERLSKLKAMWYAAT